MLPESMENAKVYGVELDTVSAGIAQQLYQKSSIAAQGFEEVNVPDSFFDGVIGNVPFGDFKVSDKRYDKQSSYYYKQEQAGMPSRYSITRDAIDEAIAHSTNLKTFDYILTQMGYEHCLSDSRKYWTIVPKGYKKPIRLKSLGENYTEDAIKRRLTENQKVLIVPFVKETVRVTQYRLPTREHKIKKVGGLYGLYLHNRMLAYVEDHIYGGKWNEYKSDSDNK